MTAHKKIGISNVGNLGINPTFLAYASSGTIVEDYGDDHLSYAARMRDDDLRKAEAISLTANTSQIEKVKVAVLRGQFAKAKELLLEIEQAVGDPKATALVLVKCRLAFYEARYTDAATAATEILNQPADGLTMTIAYQIRAACFFELGRFEATLQDVEVVQVLCTLYSYSNLSFFSKALEVRVVARTLGLEIGREKLNALWKIWESKTLPSFDLLQQLTRLEIDLCRLNKKEYLNWAFLSVKLCKLIGDRAYHRLALWDLATTLDKTQRSEFLARLQRCAIAEADQKLHNLLSDPSASTSGRTALAAMSNVPTLNEKAKHDISITHLQESELLSYSLEKIFYYHADQRIVLCFPEGKIIRLDQFPQVIKILEVWSQGNVLEVKNFFSIVWNVQNFVPRLHEQLVRSTLSRIKKQLGLNCGIREKIIYFDEVKRL